MGLNLAAGLKKQVDAGEMTKEAALAEFGRRANSMTYDKGAGYLFGTGYDGITVLAPDPKQVGTNRMDVVTNGRKLSRELMDGVKANGSILLTYEYVKPGEEKPIRKIGYAVAVPGFDMYLGTGAYLDDLDAKLKPIAWVLGLAILGIALVSGSIAWMIGRSISKPLGQLGARMQELAEGKLDGEIPGIGRGDEVGAMAATVQIFKDNAVRIRGLEQAEAETQARAAAERRAAMENIASDFERSVTGIVRSVSTAAAGMQTTAQSMTSTASDASARAATVGAASQALVRQCRHGRVRRRRAFQLGRRDFPPGGALQRDRQQGGRRRRAHQRHRRRALDRRREDRRSGQADPLDRGANQSARAQRHHRGGARRRIRPRLCGGGVGSEGARQPDREGDRGNLLAGRGDAGLHQRGGGLDRRHHRNHRADERDHGLDFDRRSTSRATRRARSPATSSRWRPDRTRSPAISAASPRRRPRPARRRPRCWRTPANSTTSPACCAARSTNSWARCGRRRAESVGGSRVGKGALAPCPPSIDGLEREWWARCALPTLRSQRLAQLNSQQVDAWKFVESDYDHLRIHEPHEGRSDVRPSPGYSQGQSGNTNLPHQITIQQSDFVRDFISCGNFALRLTMRPKNSRTSVNFTRSSVGVMIGQ